MVEVKGFLKIFCQQWIFQTKPEDPYFKCLGQKSLPDTSKNLFGLEIWYWNIEFSQLNVKTALKISHFKKSSLLYHAMFVSKALAGQKFHLSLAAQLLIKCQLWILRRARFISYSSRVMSRQPLSLIPNGSFIYIDCKINVRNQVIPKWKQIVKENLFPYSKLRKSVRIFSALRHLEDVVSSKEYERSHKLCSHFSFSK